MQHESSFHGSDAGIRLGVQLLETSQVDDQLAGLAFLERQPFVDTTRVVVAGCSFGGIQTLFGAARHVAYRDAVSISPAALSWDSSRELQSRLKNAVSRIDIPVFLIQPAKDASLEPANARAHSQQTQPVKPREDLSGRGARGTTGALFRRCARDAHLGPRGGRVHHGGPEVEFVMAQVPKKRPSRCAKPVRRLPNHRRRGSITLVNTAIWGGVQLHESVPRYGVRVSS